MADPTTAGGGTEGLREALCALMWAHQHPGEHLTWVKVVEISTEHPRSVGARRVGIVRECADALIAGPIAAALARGPVEQARVEAEVERLERDKALLLEVVEEAHAAVDFAWADEGQAMADFRSRKVRFATIRDVLNGVGSPEKRRALGFLAQAEAEAGGQHAQ